MILLNVTRMCASQATVEFVRTEFLDAMGMAGKVQSTLHMEKLLS